MYEAKLVDQLTGVAGNKAILFRYDRWDKLLFLEVDIESGTKVFLVCHNCLFFEIDRIVFLDKVIMIQDVETLTLSNPSQHFLVKCSSVELWDREKFDAYDLNLYNKLGEEKRYGIRKPIFSLEDLC